VEKLAIDFLSQQNGVLAVVIGVIAVVIWLLVKLKKAVSSVWPFLRKLVAVVEDLFGTEARPGVEARPGLMYRMAIGEERDARIEATLAEHSQTLLELQPNHGGSMKDVLKATREDLAALREDLTAHIAAQKSAVTEAKEAVVDAKDAVLAAAHDRAEVHVNVHGPNLTQPHPEGVVHAA
jgi:hypothetical protein